MPRPPFRRHKRKNATKRPLHRSSAWLRGTRNLLLVAAAVSVYQLATSGEINWHHTLLQELKEKITENSAALNQAKNALEKQGAQREGKPEPDIDLYGRVVRVADGDTLSLLTTAGDQYKIRLFAIDAPELAQSYGKQAQNMLSGLVYQKNVGITVIETDQYGRKVGTVFIDNKNVNEALVDAGGAWWYRQHGPHERNLEHAEQHARDNRLGLWNSKDKPQAPWDWRRQNRR
ncbi:MAG: thermonuclease family protein [Parahaliea sp.]